MLGPNHAKAPFPSLHCPPTHTHTYYNAWIIVDRLVYRGLQGYINHDGSMVQNDVYCMMHYYINVIYKIIIHRSRPSLNICVHIKAVIPPRKSDALDRIGPRPTVTST